MMALALAASATGPDVAQIERLVEANGHSWQPLAMASLSDATLPAISLLPSSATGVPRASHPLRLQGLQVGTRNNRATQMRKQARARVIPQACGNSKIGASAGPQ